MIIQISSHLSFLKSVKIPNIYKSTYSEICKADATAVDLGKLNKHFYELGRYVAHFDRNGFVGRMIYEVSKKGVNNVHIRMERLVYNQKRKIERNGISFT